MSKCATILVTGATGNTGARIVEELRRKGLTVRAASRNPDPADPDAVRFDWADQATFAVAVAGVDAVYLVAPIGAADPVASVQPFLDQAAAAGVRRVVMLSSSAVERGEPGLGKIHDLVVKMFAEHTVLRPSWFMQNFVGAHPLADGIRDHGQVVTATGEGRVGFIDAADIAAVAAQALIAMPPLADELVLTGPESLSYRQAAQIVSEVLQRPVAYVELTVDELAARLVAAGAAADFAAGLAALDGRIRSGEQDFTTGAVADVTGRPPTSLRRFLTAHVSR